MATDITVHLAEVEALSDLPGLRTSLSEADWERGEKIRALSQRRIFLATRGFLRELLAAQLGCPPSAVPIVGNPNEKLRLEGCKVEFSVAHCDRWCAVAISDGCPVGVDVEWIRPLAGMTEVVKEFFPPIAQAAYAVAAPERQLAVFFHWWTRIEAAVKASGRGLDDAPRCLEDAVCESCDLVPGLAVAVAARGRSPLAVAWHLATTRAANDKLDFSSI